MNISVLCKVVDNFGDVGVAWRLCKQLSIINYQLPIKEKYQIALIVDDLGAFNKIDNRVKCDSVYQVVDEIEIYDWNDSKFCHKVFSENDGEKLSLILELFQCGRPEWMEKILFEEKLERTVNIIMVDYLTAEKYAEDFHKLASLTRSKKVQKVNFMPGFTEKTGGLIIDKQWEKISEYDNEGAALVFTYERNWTPLVSALTQSNIKKVLIAQGRGKDSFIQAWNKNNTKELFELPYLNQNEWDEMMKKCSVLFIRGEESMSRACLSGIPFVWHAYPQSDEYQMVKVNALLERMRPHFSAENFDLVYNVWQDFNLPQENVNPNEMKIHISNFILARKELASSFYDFAVSLHKNGDLAVNLLEYIQTERLATF